MLLSASNGFSFGSFGTGVNTACAPATPYTGNCALCHLSDRGAPTPAKDAYLAGGTTLTDFFCPSAPPPPACTDSDNDTYAVDGGDCGPVDCDDTSAAINPGAVDIPNNGADENCDGVDSVDPSLLDNDGDSFTPAGGDCDDTDSAVNPNAVEVCTDGIDNNCNGLVDVQDPDGVDCPQTCTDNDGDTYAIDGGGCGPVDCDDTDPGVNPGTTEVCADGIDNNCSGVTDEGCDPTCPDADADSYQDATCGGTDCNDLAATINPGAAEVCGNGVDENCNGASDDTCLTCPDGTLLVIREMEYNQGDQKLAIKGRATTVGTTITILNADTGQILAEGIRVREGKWKATIRNISGTLVNIRVMTSNGCSVEQAVNSGDDDDDGHEKVGSYRDRRR